VATTEDVATVLFIVTAVSIETATSGSPFLHGIEGHVLAGTVEKLEIFTMSNFYGYRFFSK